MSNFSDRVRVEQLILKQFFLNLQFDSIKIFLKMTYHLCSFQLRHIYEDGKLGIDYDEFYQPNKLLHSWPCRHIGDYGEWNAKIFPQNNKKIKTINLNRPPVDENKLTLKVDQLLRTNKTK